MSSTAATAARQDPPFSSGLVKSLLLSVNDTDAPKRISNEALDSCGKFLQDFIEDVRDRALIVAECEHEVNGKPDSSPMIRAHHITKVAAGIIMDYS